MSTSCIDPNYIKLIVQSVILDMLNKHELQAGLQDCDAGWLGADSKVVLCNSLVALIQQSIDDGSLDVKAIKSFTLASNTLTLVDQGDHTFTVDLTPILTSIADAVPKYKNCEGNDLPSGTQLMSCAEVAAAISAAVDPVQDKVIPLKNCEGNDLPGGTQLMSCAEIATAISTAVDAGVASLKCMILDQIHHDETLTGLGDCDTPLGVNLTWLQQYLDVKDPDIDVVECPADPAATTGSSLPTQIIGVPGATAADVRAAILTAPDKFLKVHFKDLCAEDPDTAPKVEYYIPLYAVPTGGQA